MLKKPSWNIVLWMQMPWHYWLPSHQLRNMIIYLVSSPSLKCHRKLKSSLMEDKQRVLMHRHQGWNVRHGLCHIYMRYLYLYELFIAFVCFVVCSLLQRDGIFGVLCRKWQARESTGMFGNLMAIYYIMPQFIQNHSRFVMLMKTCMIS